MIWVYYTLGSAFLFSISNIVDKYLLRDIKHPVVLAMMTGIASLIISVVLFITKGFQPLSFQNIVLAAISGSFHMLMVYFYFKSVDLEEISKVIPLFFLTPFWVAILAAIFLSEVFTAQKYLGVVLLVAGAILISSKGFKIHINKAFWYVIFGTLALAVHFTISKYLLGFADVWSVFGYERFFTGIYLIPLWLLNKKSWSEELKLRKKKLQISFFNELFIGVTAGILMTIAISIGSVTLVDALASVQPFFVLIMATFLSVYHPWIISEELSKSRVVMKFIAILLLFAGSLLIT